MLHIYYFNIGHFILGYKNCWWNYLHLESNSLHMNSIRLEPLSLMCGKIPHCPLHYYVQSILNFFGDLWFKITKCYSPCVVNISLNITREKCMEEMVRQVLQTVKSHTARLSCGFPCLCEWCGLWISLIITIRVHVEIVHLLLASKGVKPVETVHTPSEGLANPLSPEKCNLSLRMRRYRA